MASIDAKNVQLPQDWFGTPTWPPFHFFEFQYGGRDVMLKRSIIAMLHFVHQTLEGVFQPVSKGRGVD